MLEQAPSMTSPISTTADASTFVYEVEGLRQNDRTENNSYSIRSSSSVFISVPRSRMNEEMRRITRLGGRIVNISTVGQGSSKSKPASAASAAN
ncbi:phycobilisome linker polypeptide [Pseudanabaena sp. PCC 6802]|uniref:phycobilisome linker polypeptide n=1 Tax=Pseudanabaena sp. PCC 6802 TaxID=118173 RepID=UPI00034A2D99|nr:phycobilisome linker polypeptide [Pseudanabaena sp. PCC 6802]